MKRVCSKCGKIIGHGQKCCVKNNGHDRNIDPEKRRFYNSYAWKKLRNYKVKDAGYCERCWSQHKIITTEQLQGHHILSYKDYPDCRLDELNIAVLCKVCNLQIGDKSLVDWSVSDEVREYVNTHRA